MARHLSRRSAFSRWARTGTVAAVALSLVSAPGAAPAKDLVDALLEARSFSTLLCLLKAAGLEGSLRGPGPFTLFAPTDEAFAMLPRGFLDVLKRPENRPQLVAMINRHLAPERLLARDRAGRRGLTPTVAGSWLMIDGTRGSLMINDDVEVLQADITVDNGVIHIIDSVVLQNDPGEMSVEGAF